MSSENSSGVSTQLFGRFLKIAKFYWISQERWQLRAGLALLMTLLFIQTAFSVLFNQQTGEFISALASKDADRFWSSIWRYAAILTAAVPIYSLYYFVRDTIALRWRRWLTHHFMTRYFKQRAYYRLNAMPGVDNPDQRIAEDINAFTQQSLLFSMIVLGACIQIIAFAGVLWTISHTLVYFLLVYSVVCTVFTAKVFGKPLIGLNFLQLQREADFRFGLVRVREHAEPIAFYRGEAREMSVLEKIFYGVFTNYQRVLRWQFKLNLFQFTHSFLTLVLPVIIIANDVLNGNLEIGSAVQATGAFAAILVSLTVIVDHFEGLSRFSAGIERLYSFSEALDSQQLDDQTTSSVSKSTSESKNSNTSSSSSNSSSTSSKTVSSIITITGEDLCCKDLTIFTPDAEQMLLKDLNLKVPPKQGLMIVGESGTGKSSLLRAIAGLWSRGSGEIIRPVPQSILFLPQYAYLPLGNLRCQLTYPYTDSKISDQELLECLERVNLPTLAKRAGGLNAIMDWSKVLSVGEQQRLSFARALLIKPRYVLLDESTSALDAANEENLYCQLSDLAVTPVSVSHHHSLLKFHEQVLAMQADASWVLQNTKNYRWE